LKWLRKAAEQDHTNAQTMLGMAYDEGIGELSQDYKEAAKWYKKAAAQESAEAQLRISLLFAQGKGVIKDYVQAHMWVNLAASNGRKDAPELRNIYEKKMTPQQIAKAQEMARNWKPKK